jgi:magnesium transporter
VLEIRKDGYEAAPHISCIASTKEEPARGDHQYKENGIKRIVALRGDMPSGIAMAGELRYASDLVRFIREETGDWFHVEVAAYPEYHPQARRPHHDLAAFKAKIDAGANSAITQYFYNADSYLHFVDEGRGARHRRADRSRHHADQQFLAARAFLGRVWRRDSALDAPQARGLRRRRALHPRFRPRRGDRLCDRLLAAGAPGLALLHAQPGRGDLRPSGSVWASEDLARTIGGIRFQRSSAVNESAVETVPRQSPLASQIRQLPPVEAAAVVERAPPAQVVEAFLQLNPAIVQKILAEMDPSARSFIAGSAPPEVAAQWKRNTKYPEGTIGQLMEPPLATFRPEMTVGEAIEMLRRSCASRCLTYAYVVDHEHRLMGLVTMRDLLFNDHAARLEDVMMKEPFALSPELKVSDAMKLTLNRHYPVYPVCDAERHLVGLIRGASLFEIEAFEITAQPGAMVGVEREERVSTSLAQSFKFRNPWLLINLVTAFAAGGVVAFSQGTVDKLVILATFLPVLAGQSGNTGCQALAVTVRGITLGDIRLGRRQAPGHQGDAARSGERRGHRRAVRYRHVLSSRYPRAPRTP